jgi:hypothetical protein
MLNGGRDRQAKFGQSPLSPHRLQTPLAGQKANIAMAPHGSRDAVEHGTRMPLIAGVRRVGNHGLGRAHAAGKPISEAPGTLTTLR